MSGMPSDNSDSLSLALDARNALKALSAFSRSGTRNDRFDQALKDAIASLNALNSGDLLFANLSTTSSYESYEQIQTVQEVQNALSDDRLTEKLRALLGDPPGEHLEESLRSAIQFFTAIENRALQRYNQSFGAGF